MLRGGAGNDTLISSTNTGYYTANVLDGGTGNDTMTGSSNSDRYLFNLGDGQDTITDNGSGSQDRIEFGAGITSADVQATRSGNDLVLALSNGSDQITVKNWFANASYWIEQVKFADGTVWDATQLTYDIVQAGTAADQTLTGVSDTNAVIRAGGGNDTVTGNDGSDQLFGEGGNDTLDGGGGNDVLDGGEGDDILRGGASSSSWNDVLRGGAGNDTLISSTNTGYYTANVLDGGTGNDTMTGSSNSDRYLFNLGDGQDTITDNGSGSQDRIEFGAGITSADVQATRSGNDLVLALANGNDQITVKNWYTGASYKIELVTFADGASLTSAQVESMAQSAGQLAARSFESTQSPGTQAAELQLLIGAMATFEGAAVDSSSLASAAIEPAGFVHRWPSADSRPLDIRHLQSIV